MNLESAENETAALTLSYTGIYALHLQRDIYYARLPPHTGPKGNMHIFNTKPHREATDGTPAWPLHAPMASSLAPKGIHRPVPRIRTRRMPTRRNIPHNRRGKWNSSYVLDECSPDPGFARQRERSIYMLLEGKKAVITGGTRGIGYAIAERFIEEGAVVTVFGSRQETADAAVEKLLAARPDAKVWGRTCDLTSLDAVTEAFKAAAEDMGGLDTVVNNAGISQSTPLLDYTADEWQKVMDLNVTAVFNGCRAGAQIMTEAGHGGTITTTSSMVSKYGQPSGCGYPTSKYAVNGLTQCLSRELAPKGIRVNAVAPGITKTDMVAALPEKMIAPLIATIPLGRIGEPEDVANAFVYLASDMSSYVTGAVIPVDGAARS